MNAIYARQSVEKADSISIESQIEFCAYELRGEPYRVYADKGFSGKNTERPAFTDLMEDIGRGLIQKVVVYKLDRISRSVLDFSTMMERFAHCNVEFVSTMEKFDTSSPMGRAMLSICIVFAQLERETIQRRVADAYFSRSQKSLYMGGRIPYGFRRVPAVIEGVRTAMYETVPEEAECLRLIYQLYAAPQSSYGDVIRFLSEKVLTNRGKAWSRTHLAALLKNPIYVRADLSIYRYFQDRGTTIVNPPEEFIGTNGCYYYKKQDSEKDGGYLVLAPHEGLISAELWLKCRAKSPEAPGSTPCQKAKNTWLAGKIKCARCGYALIDKHYPSGHRYFLCSGRMNTKGCPGPGTIYSDELEQLVQTELQRKLATLGPLKDNSRPDDRTSHPLRAALAKTESEIQSLMRRLPDADQTLYPYINERVRRLDGKKQQLFRRISSLDSKCGHSDRGLEPRSIPWEALTFEDKRRIVDLLIRVIRVESHSVAIEWRI